MSAENCYQVYDCGVGVFQYVRRVVVLCKCALIRLSWKTLLNITILDDN
jgi:hypothetical protein